MPQTLAQADALSRNRARAGRIRTTIVFVFTVVAFLVLAGLLQRQQLELQRATERDRVEAHAQCEQRRANTIKVNDTWTALQQIEQRNRFIDDSIRFARIAAYQNAKLTVPTC
jgi:adenylate kinase family enzyme